MAVYRIELEGRTKPVLLRADNKTAAIERVVKSAKAMTGDEVEALLESGEKVWKLGEEFPADEAAPEPTPTATEDKSGAAS